MDLVSLLGKANLPVRLWKEKKEKKKNKKQKNHNDRSAPSAVARSLLLQTIPIIYAAMFLLFSFSTTTNVERAETHRGEPKETDRADETAK
jgi:hypothetical protein